MQLLRTPTSIFVAPWRATWTCQRIQKMEQAQEGNAAVSPGCKPAFKRGIRELERSQLKFHVSILEFIKTFVLPLPWPISVFDNNGITERADLLSEFIYGVLGGTPVQYGETGQINRCTRSRVDANQFFRISIQHETNLVESNSISYVRFTRTWGRKCESGDEMCVWSLTRSIHQYTLNASKRRAKFKGRRVAPQYPVKYGPISPTRCRTIYFSINCSTPWAKEPCPRPWFDIGFLLDLTLLILLDSLMAFLDCAFCMPW